MKIKIIELIFWCFRIRPCKYDSRHYLDWWYIGLMLVGYPYMFILLYMFFIASPGSWLWKLNPLINGEFGITVYDGAIAIYSYLNAKEKSNGCNNGKKRAGRWIIIWWGLSALAMIVAMIFWRPFNLEGSPATALTNFVISLMTFFLSRSKKIIHDISKK